MGISCNYFVWGTRWPRNRFLVTIWWKKKLWQAHYKTSNFLFPNTVIGFDGVFKEGRLNIQQYIKRKSTIYLFTIYFINFYISSLCLWMGKGHIVHTWILYTWGSKDHLQELVFFIQIDSGESNSSSPTWWQVSLLTEPSYWLHILDS